MKRKPGQLSIKMVGSIPEMSGNGFRLVTNFASKLELGITIRLLQSGSSVNFFDLKRLVRVPTIFSMMIGSRPIIIGSAISHLERSTGVGHDKYKVFSIFVPSQHGSRESDNYKYLRPLDWGILI